MNYRTGDKVKIIKFIGQEPKLKVGNILTITSVGGCGTFLRFFNNPSGFAHICFRKVIQERKGEVELSIY